VNVIDLEVASVPVTRFITRRPEHAGGVTIRLVEGDPQSCVIRFFDATGADLSEDAQRKVERLFGREDFRRAFPGEIGDIGFPPRALERYTAALEATVDIAAIRAAKFKLVVDYAYGSTSFVMPNVLAKLGADILGLNPYASTEGALAYERATHSERVAAYVRTSGAQLGAVVDPDGERLTIIDDTGHILTDEEMLLAFLTLVSGNLAGDTVALPVTVTSHAETIVAADDVRVRRTKLSTPALMDAAAEPGVGFAASTDGGFILPGFLPAFDAAASLVKLLELLARTGRTLSAVVEALPRPHLAHETVVTPWVQKGTVMRSLVEMSKDREVHLIDGVKVRHDEGWALAVPDPEEPITHIWAEGSTDADARALVGEYSRRIRQLLR
jgi:mannose-1-phosphate guanylyltransferase/phosphomannomutase